MPGAGAVHHIKPRSRVAVSPIGPKPPARCGRGFACMACRALLRTDVRVATSTAGWRDDGRIARFWRRRLHSRIDVRWADYAVALVKLLTERLPGVFLRRTAFRVGRLNLSKCS